MASYNELDSKSIEIFREYLQIPSVHPDINYDACVAFLEKQAKSLNLPIKTYILFPKKPIVILTWTGQEPGLPSILLNSHMDVVPVFEEKWTHKPFDADMDAKGNIYARGAQDMKCVGIQYLEAIRRLKQEGTAFKRTLHISFVPDEEIGGVQGLRAFVKSKDFKDLNIGFALDEGLASPSDTYVFFNGERSIWHFAFRCPGQPGHGSLLLDDTAGEKVRYILDKVYTLRQQEKEKLKNNPSLTIGDVLTLNVTSLKGGVQSNVIPTELTVGIDCRIPVTMDIEKWTETVNQWAKEAGNGVWIEFEQKEPQIPVTKIDDSNQYWVAFKSAADKLNIKLKQEIFTGGTDCRFVRGEGIPAIGFSPMNNTPVLLHDNDEYLNANVFLKGIEIYCKIIPAVANVA